MMNRIVLLALMCLLGPVAIAHSVVLEDGTYKIRHTWTHDRQQWSCSLNVPASLYDYYGERTHYGDDYVHYVLSEYDRDCIRSLMQIFRSEDGEQDHSNVETVYNVVSFVQSLDYVQDKDSKGQNDYVRFPVETLVDGVGDCEDMSILAASILYEMGYGVLLISLPDHLAIGVNCTGVSEGSFYEYGGSKYYYLEMTSAGWEIGQMPKEYQTATAKLIPLINKPLLHLARSKYSHDAYMLNDDHVNFDLECELSNLGPGRTEGLLLRVEFKQDDSYGAVFAKRTFYLDELDEGRYDIIKESMSIPRPFHGVIVFRVEGDNFDTELMVLEGVDLP